MEGQYYASKRLGKGQTYAYQMKKPPQGTAGIAFTCMLHPEEMDGGVVLADE